MRRRGTWMGMLAAALALTAGKGYADQLSVTFDQPQLVNNDPILQFYNGGTTFRGIGPGPSLGVSFTLNARVFTTTAGLAGTFTAPGILELYSDTAREGEPISFTMDIQQGLAGSLAFDYAAIDTAGSINFYSGLDGTGALLAGAALPLTSPITGPGTFVEDAAAFPGIAHSVVFDGGNKQLAIDDLTFTAAPEPSPLILLTSLLALAGASRLRTRRA